MNGAELKSLRKSTGLSQTEFGDKIGRCKRAILNYEKAQDAPIPDIVELAIKQIFKPKRGKKQ